MIQTAIKILRDHGVTVDDNGTIISGLPEGMDGIELDDILNDATMQDGYCYTIQNDQLEKIEV